MRGLVNAKSGMAHLAALVAVLLLAGCDSKIGTYIDVTVSAEAGLTLESESVTASAAGKADLVQTFAPASSVRLAVAPTGLSDGTVVTVEARGLKGGNVTVLDRAHVKVRSGQRVSVSLHLTAACAGVLSCTADKTCLSGTCVALPPIAGPDGGTVDASTKDAVGGSDSAIARDAPAGDRPAGATPAGGACTTGGECQSGSCAGQVCCDKPCDGICQSCAAVFTGGKDGVCAPVMAGMNAQPARDCLTNAADPCANDGTCDGAGACRLQGSSQSCAPSACSGAVGSQSYQATASCDGMGKCVSPAKQSCGQYDCSPMNGCAKPCTSDTNCGDGNFCGSDSICRTKKTDGSACTAVNECTHGFCVDGFCCESDCSKKGCYSCARSNSGQADGKCAPVMRGKVSPRPTDCKAGDAKTCGLDGLCDGAGACESYGNTTTCADASCSGSKFTATSTCDGAGKCAAPAAVDCGSFQCAVTGCRTKCTLDTDCSATSYCASDGTCAAKSTNGSTCKAAKECSLNSCIDGFCCESSCGQTCYGCSLDKTGKANGTCAPLKAGTSRSSTECPASSMASCGNDGTCDGAGKCRVWASGTSCAAGSCSTTGFTGPKACDGASHCNGPAAVSCGAYPCDATSGCAITCSASVPCAGDTYCDSGTSKCVAKKNNGQACGSGNECVGKTCADGVCCNSGCTGSCMSCRNTDTGMPEGTCAQIKAGTKSATDCPTDTTPCGRDGTCNGGGACTYKASGTSCGSATCNGSTLQPASTCDGKGTCSMPGTSTCGFGCQSGTPACATSCPGGQKICNNGCILNAACCGGCTGGKQCVNGSCGCALGTSACGGCLGWNFESGNQFWVPTLPPDLVQFGPNGATSVMTASSPFVVAGSTQSLKVNVVLSEALSQRSASVAVALCQTGQIDVSGRTISLNVFFDGTQNFGPLTFFQAEAWGDTGSDVCNLLFGPTIGSWHQGTCQFSSSGSYDHVAVVIKPSPVDWTGTMYLDDVQMN